jgi:hypothetical protein
LTKRRVGARASRLCGFLRPLGVYDWEGRRCPDSLSEYTAPRAQRHPGTPHPRVGRNYSRRTGRVFVAIAELNRWLELFNPDVRLS